MFGWIKKRATGSFTQAVTASLVSQASGRDYLAKDTAVAEIAGGLYQRSFMAAEVKAKPVLQRAINPRMLGIAGRELILYGNSVWAIKTSDNGVLLKHPEHWELLENKGKNSIFYKATYYNNKQETLPEASIVHFKYGLDSYNNLVGISPLASGHETTRLAASIERKMADEADKSPSGYILPLPRVAETINKLRDAIGEMRGQTLLVETTQGGWGEGKIASPSKDWEARRLGFDPPKSVLDIRRDTNRLLLESCGIPHALISDEGVGQRSAYSRFIHTSLEPLSYEMEWELSNKLNDKVKLSFNRLVTHTDLSTKAKSFKALVDAGMPAKEAALIAEVKDYNM